MPKLQLNRHEKESTALATISLFAVACLRFPAEHSYLFHVECLVLGLCFATILFIRKHRKPKLQLVCSILMLGFPILSSFISRRISYPIAIEMTVITVFGAAGLLMAVHSRRTHAMSLVASGFLTLFATIISDSTSTIAIAITWITICVWHLVANHWERIDLCTVENVKRREGIRPVTVVLATSLFVVGGLMAKDRFGESTLLQNGFMPVSGGSSWSDPGALSGVGTGDAVIAATEKANSFGAVDSELFLESTESSLFDMFSDSIGEPKKKIKYERRQAISSEKVITSHDEVASSEEGSSSFSTARKAPNEHRHHREVETDAVVQWAGPSGIRLAMNRYDTFDGVDWSNQASHANRSLTRIANGDQIWFFEPKTARQIRKSRQDQVQQGQLKVLRLGSTRLPVPMMTSGVHIKGVDRQDFFGIEDDGSMYMPDRNKVPPLTVIHVASSTVMEDELIETFNQKEACDVSTEKAPYDNDLSLLVKNWTQGSVTTYDKLRSLVKHLREDFEFDRSSKPEGSSPLSDFLSTRRGGDHLFATTAALMARKIGLESRLVTGFYVRPSAIDIAAQHSNVMPEDVHVWVEIQLDNRRWIEIEPTPGYREPDYRPSVWLAGQRFVWIHWPKFFAVLSVAGLAYVARFIWIEWLLNLLWLIATFMEARRRLKVVIWIIEFRAKLLGHPRPKSTPPRDWLLEELTVQSAFDANLRSQVESFCDFADSICFGPSDGQATTPLNRDVMGKIVSDLRIAKLREHLMENNT